MSVDPLFAAVRKDNAFSILVWGPGEKGPHYAIRLTVRDRLREYFARVEFSEDIDDVPAMGSFWLENIAFLERLHATKANIVYLIPTSTGPQLELILYWSYRNIGPKIHVLLLENGPENSFIERVTWAIVRRMPTHQVHRFPPSGFNENAVANYCVEHAKSFYMSTHPLGPPDLELA